MSLVFYIEIERDLRAEGGAGASRLRKKARGWRRKFSNAKQVLFWKKIVANPNEDADCRHMSLLDSGEGV